MSNGDEAVTGSIAVTEEDLTRGVVEGSGVFRMRWVFIALFAAEVVGYGVTDSYVATHHAVLAVVGLVMVSAYLLIAPRLRARKMRAALLKTGDDRVLFRFDADGFTVSIPGETADPFPYGGLSRARENATTLLLSGPALGTDLIIPKRAFSDEQVQRARGWLAAHVKIERGFDGGLIAVAVLLAFLLAFFLAWQFLDPPHR